MCGSTDTCSTLGDYLISTIEENGGQQLLSSKLESYFFWKASVGKMQRNLRRQGKFSKLNAGAAAATPPIASGNRPVVSAADANQYENAALKRKAEYRRGQAPSTKRRRVRGGGAVGATTTTETDRKLFAPSTGANPDALESEAGVMADM
jgi:DNA excision repair protein ERCC-4